MKKIIRKILGVSTKTVFYLFIAASFVCILALRHNNQRMVELRDAVYVADKNGGDVNKALNNLRTYVYSHMNTDLSSGKNNIKPPIQLKYTYQRLYDSQLAQVQANNQQIYSAAQIYCRSHSANSQSAELACIQNYAVNHGVQGANINIPAGLYQFDFVSPSWSPDLAGWTLALSFVLLLILLAKVGLAKLKR